MVKSISPQSKRNGENQTKESGKSGGKASIFVSSKVMCWVALDRGTKIANMLKKYKIYRTLAERSRQDKNRCDDSRLERKNPQFFPDLRKHGLRFLPCSMEPYGFIEANDIRYHQTVKAIKKALLHKGLMYRYNSKDDFGLPSSAFTICTFWLVRALFVIGEKEEAPSVRRNTEMLQSLRSVQRRFGLRHQRTIREFPPSLFPSGSGKHGHSICRRRQEIIVHSTLKNRKEAVLRKHFFTISSSLLYRYLTF